jgi:hypothetical protein
MADGARPRFVLDADKTDKRPKSIKAYDQRVYRNRQICAAACPTHTGQVPGFCERPVRHIGMHSHLLREGMVNNKTMDREYDATRPDKGCSWDTRPHAPRSPKRGKDVAHGPMDDFAMGAT